MRHDPTLRDRSAYAQMIERRRATNAAAQRRRRSRQKALEATMASNVEVCEETVENGLASVPNSLPTAELEAAENLGEHTPDKSVSLFQTLLGFEAAPSSSEQVELSNYNLVAVYRMLYTRLGLPALIMESYKGDNPVPQTWANYEVDRILGSKDNVPDLPNAQAADRPDPDQTLFWDRMPSNMHPTALQLADRHHPFFDLFCPWPRVRDRVIAMIRKGTVDRDVFCQEMLQHPLTTGYPSPFLIWQGDPADPDNWEVEESFALRYRLLFDNEIIQRTNWWREKRGLAKIVWSP